MVVHNCPNKRLPFRGVPFMFTIAEKNDSAMQLHLPLPPAMDSDFTGMSILGISQGADGWRLKGPKTRWCFSCFFSEKSWGSWWKMMGISFNITCLRDLMTINIVGYSVDNELVDVCPWMNGRFSSKPWARRLQHDMLDCIFPHTRPIWGFLYESWKIPRHHNACAIPSHGHPWLGWFGVPAYIHHSYDPKMLTFTAVSSDPGMPGVSTICSP